ncbi:enoyl-CoA hydratase/isomerase family protein [Acidiphilium sp.]|uniref:enoyl-CoA hydratase/isomerase family protein n=1 Tax=Acidiphilium TaxID=522 RepID=UPI00258AC99A|nr:enoyl-CoA hydratase/isomerase family protein [Acidiphilium sp.]
MTETPPILERHGAIARLRLNRPALRNRLGADDLAVLLGHCATLAADDSVRVVVFEAAGPVFSAGFDLDALSRGDTGDAEDGPGGIGRVGTALAALPQPVIARLHGNLYGGAVDLALACDFRIGVTGMELLMPAARIGLHYYRSGLARAVERIGPDATRLLFVSAQTIDAATLLRIGYLTQLAAADGLDAAVDALAARLEANAPLAVRGMKAAIARLAAGTLDGESFAAGLDAAHRNPVFIEAMGALRAKKRGG